MKETKAVFTRRLSGAMEISLVVATDDEITTPVEDRLVMTGVSCP
jgi:hypothetical protein